MTVLLLARGRYYLDEPTDTVEYDLKAIAKNYAKTWLVLDIVSGIPFDMIMYGSGDYDFSDSYAMHMWYSTANRQFRLAAKVTPRYFMKKAGRSKSGGKKRWTTYQRMIRSVIPAGLRADLYEMAGKNK